MMSSLTWFITGASNGFGLILSLHALKAGHKVIGAMRNKKRASDAVEAIESAGGHVIEMDMTEAQDSIVRRIQDVNETHGAIDVLVNNAGYAMLGPISQFTEQEVQTQIQTNFYGPLYAIQAVLPAMRARGSGTIVNISSVAGQDGQPTCGLYAASKFALEGLSEALAREEAGSGVSVLIVEPGGFRTNFLSAFVSPEKGVGGGAVGESMGRWSAYDGRQPGDPRKGAEVIFQVVTGEREAGRLRGRVLRLPLGKDAVARIEAKAERVKMDVAAARDVACGTDF
ncbi:hypothetical protein diail_1951 [Diaporthe ilicicola]|nr:hypothetical protein diail_1951 [Diaporthe ilicicola]